MFFERRPHRRGARDDPGRRRDGPARGAGQAPADAARRLRRALRDHGRPAGDDPPARPAAARVPAAHARRRSQEVAEAHGRRRPTSSSGARRRAARVQPDARPSAAAASAITYPEIDEMQARAIIEAAVEVAQATGEPVVPEIMIPLVGDASELELVEGAHRSRWPSAVLDGDRRHGRVPGRHDDRAAARRARAPTRSPRRPSSSPSAPTT